MRKFLLRTLVLTLLLASLFTITAFAEDAVITGSDVNLRSGPGTNYEVLDCLPKGATVTVNDRSNSQWYKVTYNGRSGFIASTYLRLVESTPVQDEILIEDGGDSSYTEPTPASTPSPSDSSGVVIVTGTAGGSSSGSSDGSSSGSSGGSSSGSSSSSSSTPGYINAMYVRFRSGPSTNSSVLGTYNKGTVLTITGSSGDWTAVTISGKSGYVFSQYVSKGSPSGSSTSTTTPTPTPTPAPSGSSSGEIIIVEPADTPKPTTTPAPTPPAGSQAGYITGDYVRFRSGPSTSSTILGTYNRGKKISITGTSGSWTAAVIDGKSGYVYSQYVAYGDPGGSGTTVEPTTSSSSEPGYINGNNVRLRSAPSTSSEILGEYNSGTALTITGSSGDWTAVTIGSKSGYVYSQYVSKGTITVTPSSGGGSTTGNQIAEYALQYVGYNYVWGGKDPSTGFDCSGLVYYVYGHFGYTLPRVANDQASYGTAVSLDNIQPGDILCFYSGSNYVGHVGIYIGNNKFVHASTSTTGVIVSELTGYYQSRGFVIRRVV